jgi:hypothetical protein
MIRLILANVQTKHNLIKKKVKVEYASQIGSVRDAMVVGTITNTNKSFSNDILITPQSNKDNMIELIRSRKGISVPKH